jgi:hypothetical protein
MATRTWFGALVGASLAFALAAALLLMPRSARADGDFAMLDSDRDGKVTRDEAGRQPHVIARFDRLDKDRDGSLTLPEFAALEITEPKVRSGLADTAATQREPRRGARQW